jgi:hypothetical protein
LAVKFGSDILLDDLLVRLSADGPWRDDPRGSGRGARFLDLSFEDLEQRYCASADARRPKKRPPAASG